MCKSTQREPEANEQLMAATGVCATITSADGTYDLIIASSGHIYIDSRYDGTLNAQSLCLIPGHFRQGIVAEALKQNSTTNWLSFKLTSDSTTAMGRTSVPLSKPIPDKPTQL